MSWEWYDETPEQSVVEEKLASLPEVWGVKVVDYIDYVLPMTKNQKMETSPGVEKRVPVTKLYMQVAGRVKMIEHAQERNKWIVDEIWNTLSLDPVVREVSIWVGQYDVDGDIRIGSRTGISKIVSGNWEKMETAARGRALGAWGFGVLPGSGIASFDEMEFYGVDLTEETQEVKKKTPAEVIEEIMSARVELAQSRGDDIEEIDKKLQAYVLRRWGTTLKIDKEKGIDLKPMKHGALVLMHNDLINQLKRAQELDDRQVE